VIFSNSLLQVSEWYDVVIFTAGVDCYAEAIVKNIDPHNKFIKAIYHRAVIFYFILFYFMHLIMLTTTTTAHETS
jgi:NLI interacting factor-like phosphatase